MVGQQQSSKGSWFKQAGFALHVVGLVILSLAMAVTFLCWSYITLGAYVSVTNNIFNHGDLGYSTGAMISFCLAALVNTVFLILWVWVLYIHATRPLSNRRILLTAVAVIIALIVICGVTVAPELLFPRQVMYD